MCLEVSAVIQEQRMVSWKFAEAFRSRELGVWSKGNEDRHLKHVDIQSDVTFQFSILFHRTRLCMIFTNPVPSAPMAPEAQKPGLLEAINQQSIRRNKCDAFGKQVLGDRVGYRLDSIGWECVVFDAIWQMNYSV